MEYTTINVPPDDSWHSTGLGVTSGQRLSIYALNRRELLKGVTTTVEVDSRVDLINDNGVDTGICKAKNQTITITASGTWCWDTINGVPQQCYGPDGDPHTPAISGSPLTGTGIQAIALVGKIGDEPSWHLIGSGPYTFSGASEGELRLIANTKDFTDNFGSITATITTSDVSSSSTLADDVVLARINGGTPFTVGEAYDDYAAASGSLELSIGCGSKSIPALVVIDAPGIPNHDGDCPFCIDAGALSYNPIKLRDGDKVWSETDLTVQTPAGPLAFTRSYRQSKQSHPEYQFMGLGWSHNHAYKLSLTGTSPTRKAEVYLPEGGILKFNEATSGHFNALAGSTSALDYAGSNYILTAQDKSTLTFDGTTLGLIQRSWPNGEVWTYSYVSSRLSEIADGYGRKLQFSYISNSGQPDHNQLWRIGDQTASGLSGGSPSGRYVQLGYTPEKLNNVAVAGAKALLSSIKDTRANTWTYDYFGQSPLQTDPQKLNLLLKRLSPSVDTTGDGSADGAIPLEELTYTLENTAIALDGDMEDANVTNRWNVIGSLIANQYSTTQVDVGSAHSRYIEADALGEGIESDPWDLTPGRFYVITARVYPQAGRVKMQIKDALVVDESQSGTSTWETLRIVYSPSGDAQQRQLQFLASEVPGGNAKFYIDTVMVAQISDITQARGNAALTTAFEFQADGKNVTTEKVTAANKTDTHQFANGVYLGKRNPVGDLGAQVLNAQYRPAAQVDPAGNKTALEWSGDGKQLQSVTDALNHKTAFIYSRDETLHASLDAEWRSSFYAYENTGQLRQPTRIFVTHPRELAINGDMELTSDWTNVNTPTTNTRSATHVDSGLYSRYVDAPANAGIQGNTWEVIAGQTYIITARVYPVAGKVRMKVLNEVSFPQPVSATASNAWETLTAIYTPTANGTGRQLQFVADGGVAQFYVDTVSIKTTADLIRNGGMELNNSDWTKVGTAATTVSQSSVKVDTGSFSWHVNAAASFHGLEAAPFDLVANRTYVILARIYIVNTTISGGVGGINLELLNSDGFSVANTTHIGSWHTLLSFGTPPFNVTGARMRFLSVAGPSDFYLDSVHILDATFLKRWQEFTYDTQGRVLTEKLIDPSDGTSVVQQITRAYHASGDGNGLPQTVTQEDIGGTNDVTTTYTYDSAGRVVQTQQSSAFGNCSISRTVYDAAGNVVASLCNFQPGTTNPIFPTNVAQAQTLRQRLYNGSDPDHYTDPNTNRLTIYEYDTLKRRVKTILNAEDTQTPAYQQISLTVYDGLDRVIRTISNYVANGAIPHPYTAAHNAFSHGTDNNQNLVTDTAYNVRGMVRSQTDVLGNVTLYGYDDAGRLVKTIRNANQPTYNNDYINTSPDPSLSSYSPSGLADKDIVTVQVYDAVGNLVKTVDPLGNVHYTAYDALNRPVQTTQSAQDSANISLNLGDVNYSAVADPRSAGYVPSTDPDRDLLQATEFDKLGRVIRSYRLLENRPASQREYTLFGYDTLGRQVKVVRSASKSAYDISADPDLSGYPANPGGDQDIVTQTVYDTQGRILYTIDAMNVKTQYAYDGLGRQFKTIANCSYVSGSPAPSADTYKGDLADPAEDIIVQTYFDTSGRVQRTKSVLRTNDLGTDLEWRWTLYGYDDIGRPIKTIQNASNESYNINADPDLSGYTPVSDSDKDIITRTEYDAQGRVWRTFDTRDNETRFEYDILGRRAKVTVNYVNGVYSSSAPDEDLISTTTYDLAGRVTKTVDPAGIESRYEYDALGRRTKVTANYVNGVYSSSAPDEDLISSTAYNKAGQVVSTTDVRGTQTTFTYDKAGRRLTVMQAANTGLAAASYSCYDKAGRVLRSIQNWLNEAGQPSPDARDAEGHWLFNPDAHGNHNDRNLITSYQLDRLGRPLRRVDPLGNTTLSVYDKDGQIRWLSDAEYTVTHYRYDGLRRRRRVIQGYQAVPTQSKIVFTSDRDGNLEIYSMDVNGLNQLRLTNHAAIDTVPAWSPDGSKIAFGSDRASLGVNSDLYIMDANGSNLQQVTTNVSSVVSPAWSPDGSQLVVVGVESGDVVLYVVSADGSASPQLIYRSDDLGARSPAWSPDGGLIAFARGADPIWEICTIQPDGTQFRQLTYSSNAINDAPAWSPDGRQIAFQSSRDGNREIYVMNADGSNPVNLTQYSGVDDRHPAWSPDGTQIAFYSNRDGDQEVYIMNADGTNVTKLTSNAYNDQFPDWSPKVIDPANWLWNGSLSRWEDGSGVALPHGSTNDRNIIVDVSYDKSGRILSQREPRGNLTQYTYDRLDRRLSLVNPLPKTWSTAYTDLVSGGTQVSMTYPGVNGGSSYTVQRDFDRLGRLSSIAYGDPGNTPDVKFVYDAVGNRTKMSEYSGASFTNRVRETTYSYDDVRRLTSVGFDNDGNGTVDETVSYEYDAGGLRTKLTLPGSLNITYIYDARGQLISLTDWSSQTSQFAYDLAGRHVATDRVNRLRSTYQHDAAGRLKRLRHTKDFKTFAHFEYQVDRRGNRTQALEAVAHSATITDTTIAYNDKGLVLSGTWAEVGGFKESTAIRAQLKLAFLGENRKDAMGVLGNNLVLTMGTGPDHSLYDLYIGGSLWQSFDGYAAMAGQVDIPLEVHGEGPHLLEIRNRAEKNKNSSGYKARFKQLLIADRTYDLYTFEYTYDKLSRLLEARKNPGVNSAALDADLPERYQYAYDRVGNTLSIIRSTNGTPTTSTYTYNAANQIISINGVSAQYDNNGNLTSLPGSGNYTWDRANRLINVPTAIVSYAYDGLGNRISRTKSGVTRKYLLDVQPGLAVVLVESDIHATNYFVHGPRGVHARDLGLVWWNWTAQDGLGSVRLEIDNNNSFLTRNNYEPYGTKVGGGGSSTPYGFTGEMQDAGDITVYLRARAYHPTLGVFTSLDPFEGTPDRPMSLNGYSYVEGNPTNLIDPSGMCVPYINCSVPTDGPVFDYCSIDPNASGCSGIGTGIFNLPINPPTGDYTTQELLSLSYILSNGTCSYLSNQQRPRGITGVIQERWDTCIKSDHGLFDTVASCVLAGAIGYAAGLAAYNLLTDRPIGENFDMNEMLRAAVFGGAVCGLNWSIPAYSAWAIEIEMSVRSQAFAFAYIGAMSNLFDNINTNRNLGNNDLELSIWAALGALNAFSVCGGWLGIGITSAANAFNSLISKASDNWYWTYRRGVRIQCLQQDNGREICYDSSNK